MVDDGSLDYFKAHGFTAVHLVVPDSGTYQTELNKIKSLGMKPIIDVEEVIWDGGQLQSTPITSFGPYFQSLKNAGWEYVSSEGGRTGDLAYMAQFFKGYVNYNCDQCGLWKDVYKDPFTVMNSWESYYTSEWPYIQTGAKEAAALGKQNGILAGVWEYGGSVDYNPILTNSKNGGSPSYKSMLDWSYANGIGFNHFQVWCGLNSAGLSRYKELGFEQVVADLQTLLPTDDLCCWRVGSLVQPRRSYLLQAPALPYARRMQTASTSLSVGTDNALWHKHYQSASGWGTWESLGGYLTSSPAAVSRGAGKIDRLCPRQQRRPLVEVDHRWRRHLERLERDRRPAPRRHRPGRVRLGMTGSAGLSPARTTSSITCGTTPRAGTAGNTSAGT